MLAIRMKRTGRRGHAQFRVIVQDSHFHPTRGKVVAYLGSYDPHTKVAQLDKETAAQYLGNGAQPSDRVARLLRSEGVKLPAWVEISPPKKKAIKNAEKLRRNRPADAAPAEKPAASEVPAAETPVEEVAPATEPAETPAESTATETEVTAEAPAAEQEAKAEAPAEEPAPEQPAEPEPAPEPAEEKAAEAKPAEGEELKSS